MRALIGSRVQRRHHVLPALSCALVMLGACRENTGPGVAKKLALPDSAQQVVFAFGIDVHQRLAIARAAGPAY